VNSCVFCDFSKLEPRLVASMENFNVVATLGQVTNGGYLLVIPVSHTPCLAAFSHDQVDLLGNVVDEVGNAIQEEYSAGLTMFEHGIIGQTIPHAHLHLLPATIDMTKRITTDFPDSRIEVLPGLHELRQRYEWKQSPYLLWTDPVGDMRVCWNPPAVPMYLRIVAAEMLGVPERANWRSMDPGLDAELWQGTVDELSTYFTV